MTGLWEIYPISGFVASSRTHKLDICSIIQTHR